MPSIRPRALVLVLMSLAGCGGSLAPPDEAGNGGIVAACQTPIPVQSVPGMPCRFPIPPPPCDQVDRAHISVLVNGTAIPEDTSLTNGWTYSDTTYTMVQIYGPICDAITAGTPTTVAIMYRIWGIAALPRTGAPV